MTGKCQTCGEPIVAGGRSGRTAVYCSQACRQRAYRERRQPAGVPAEELVTEIGDRVRRLRLAPALAFHADVESLSPRFAQLRRLAREAREAREETPAPPPTPLEATAAENVTPDRVTNRVTLGEEAFATLTDELFAAFGLPVTL
ncbi:hypothetical protein [Streptomyces sp. SPB162]|uniref:hypothetical protein n=1 Tax=Streptomyces sp. SPB162 TaxID=2940560 RepID=UPI00240744B6|nr:hypothetical protein [Streptomyces sp. SPB162]MDF9811093.1 hypothetical protein [Streptomyces sp. SPB162]